MELNEIWVEINGFEKLYHVSNKGRIKALPKTWRSGPKGVVVKSSLERILKPTTTNHGYYIIRLHDGNGNKRSETVHRLVCEHFIPNSENKPCINHIDHVRTNNKVENLEWCTYAENNAHSRWYKIQPEQRVEIIELYNKYNYTHQVIANMYNVSDVCIGKILKGITKKRDFKGRLSNVKGKVWSQESKDKANMERKLKPRSQKKILCVDTGIVYNSLKEVKEKLHVSNIGAVLKGKIESTKGMKFVYYKEHINEN